MELLLLIVICGAVVYIQGLLLGKGALREVSVTRSFSGDACYAGDRMEMVETIENAKRLPVPWLRLETMLPASIQFRSSGSDTSISRGDIYQNHTSLFMLPPHVKIIRTHPIVCARRGVYHMQTASLTAGDLFAFHTPSLTVSLPHVLTVYPVSSEMSLPDSWSSWQGELEVRRWVVEDPFVVSGTRAYAPGDAFNRIDWKASARAQDLQVRRHGHTADPRAMILLNTDESEESWGQVTRPEDLETAISCVAAMAANLLDAGLVAGLAHNGVVNIHSSDSGRVDISGGHGQLEAMLSSLAAIEPKSRMPFHELMRRETEEDVMQADYLIVTSFTSIRIREAGELLAQAGHRVTFVEPPLSLRKGGRS